MILRTMRRRIVPVLLLVVFVAALVLSPLLLAGCSSHTPPDPSPPPPWADAVVAQGAEVFARPRRLMGLLQSMMGDPPPVYGNVRISVVGTSCLPAQGGNPIALPPSSVPVAGRRFLMRWQTEVFPRGPRSVAMLCSVRSTLPAPVLLNDRGMPGCLLQLDPDFLVVPQQTEGGLLRHVPATGEVILDWVPDSSLIGQQFALQLLVAVPDANASGHLLSNLVVLTVGNR